MAADTVQCPMAMRAWSAIFAYTALLGNVARAQTPSFDAAHVLFVDRPVPLAPGLVLSIFGTDLGPSVGCQGFHDEKGIYPTSLCDTHVLVAGAPAGLLYVAAGQINFMVPKETPVEGSAALSVVYQGRSSKAIAMPLGVETAALLLDGPARVGMPVWLRLKPPYNQEPLVRYPFMVFPASFGCNDVEVRRDGELLPRFADWHSQAFGGIVFSGSPCGSLGFSTEPHFKGRFPLHLQYRFDQPGGYEVRLIERHPFTSDPPTVMQWTTIEILPGGRNARRQWLADRNAHAPTDAADLLSDFLPGILGVPDDESLRILLPYLHHPDHTVREYTKFGLTYWPADQVAAEIWEIVRAHGPSDSAVDLLFRAPSFARAHAAELLEAAIPYLESNSPVLAEGAARALNWIALSDAGVSADVRARATEALRRVQK